MGTNCKMCGIDINHRRGNAIYCERCAREKQLSRKRADGKRRSSTPKAKERKLELQRIRRADPEYRKAENAKQKIYRAKPENKERQRARRQQRADTEPGYRENRNAIARKSRIRKYGEIQMIDCGVCEKTFKPRNSRAKWCSKECASIGKKIQEKEKYRKKRIENGLFVIGFSTRECGICKKEFTPTTSYQKYCDPICQRKNKYQKWQERYDLVGKYSHLRKRIYDKQKGICPICNEFLKLTEWPHEIDHIVPVSKAGAYSKNKYNLRLLCRKCHKEKTTAERKVV